MTRISRRHAGVCAAVVIVLACGEVPTFQDGIASISAVELPSLVVGAGDVLRDSTGAKAPLRVEAFDLNGGTIAGVPITYIVTPIDTGIHIDENGYLTASDSIRSVHIVARVGDRLQTTQALLNVVPIPDQVLATGTTEPLVGFPAKGPLQVTVSGTRKAARAPTQGVVVSYQILSVNGGKAVDSARVFLVDDQNVPLRDTPTAAIDTTDASGIASRFVLVSDTTGITSVEVRATARPLRGETLTGNPVVFTIPLKKTP
ncbi:MAG: hypothetical protein M3Z05_08920 [Gemmatimonadota bacterium]|nr:hypothetical protein [Gemmatimonadota bacterium]